MIFLLNCPAGLPPTPPVFVLKAFDRFYPTHLCSFALMKVMIINGPNLNLLGKREEAIYGNISFDEYLKQLKVEFNIILHNQVFVECFYS